MFNSIKMTAGILLLAGLLVAPVNAEIQSTRGLRPLPLRSVVLNESSRPIPQTLRPYVQLSQYIQYNLLESKAFVRLQDMAEQWWGKHNGRSVIR